MMKKYTLILLSLLVLWSLSLEDVKAQDPHFSQFNTAPLHLNPAMAGVFQGSFRVVANYRSQWASVIGPFPYRTYAVSFETKFYGPNDDFFTVGLSLLDDQAGEAQYSQTKSNLTFSYLKQLSGNRHFNQAQYLVAGGQVGLGQHSLDWSALQFSQQFDGQQFNGSLPSGEVMGDRSRLYMNFNAGLMWYGIFGERQSIYAGLAAHHLNSPNISFYEATGVTETLYRKFSLHAGGELPLGPNLSILPGVLAMNQGPAWQVMTGANFRYTADDWQEVALRAGIWGRVVGKQYNSIGTDAVSIMAGIEYFRWTLIFSYDVNTSTLVAASQRRGAFEIALIYTHPERGRRGSINCPTF